ncbi:MAG: alanine--tRNA ligase [Acidimicrobiia bacterium]
MAPTSLTANQLRSAFTGFFAERGHTVVPSAKLIPHDPTVLFTVAGMVPFKPYFLGDEVPPYRRATTVQKCVRAGGKHNDLDDVGRTARHLVFFEMLGNFSFGDYFKADAIPFAWQFVTDTLGLDPERLWVTVHLSDDEAAEIWHDAVGVPRDRIQRLDEDNFWRMGDVGPCGPCSEIFWDKGPAYGHDGGPEHGSDARFVEIWNLVFMQYAQQASGEMLALPKPSIDTGAGLERILGVLQNQDSVWEIDVFAPILEMAQSVTGKSYVVGDYEDRTSFSLRVLAEHARSSTMLVNDGVFPSNEDRGYVLRRIIRRAVRHAYLLGSEHLVMPKLVEAAIDVMGDAYPDVIKNRDFITGVITREEERFRQTLKTGLGILEDELERLGDPPVLAGPIAFKLHDTYGFPLEVTKEITEERGIGVDTAGFEEEMAEQRRRAKGARKDSSVSESAREAYQEIVEQFGTTDFTGYAEDETEGRVLAVLPHATDDALVEIFLDRTPFYAESGGQVGDTGTIRTETGEATVVDTTLALPGLRRHTAHITSGEVAAGQVATASIDVTRRNSIRRNHTGTHLLHWALRKVLGEHVKQAGSQVEPDRLRFDFSHYAPVTAEEIAEIERLVNDEVLSNPPVRSYETTKSEAEALGAIAFFGDKYGDVVRVLEAGRNSLELCGGTHVSALGDIGTIKVVSEGSIGSNLRRLEAVTGASSVALLQRDEAQLAELAALLNTTSEGVADAVKKRLEEIRVLRDEMKQLRVKAATGQAGELATTAVDGVVVARIDGPAQGDLRELALAVRQQPGIRAVILAGAPEAGGAALVAAVTSESGFVASDLIRDAARAVKGGGGKSADIAVAGGKDPAALDEAVRLARVAAGLASA